ncbi:MAG: WD40/YVTN/BNR-like repeat-containing protein, partial [Vicinamibacterales bacterium]
MSRSLRLLLTATLVTALVPTVRPVPLTAQGGSHLVPPAAYGALRWRNVGGARGGRVTGLAGVRQQPHTFYIGSSGGGVWKTDDAGINWYPVGDGDLTTGSIGSIDVAPSSPNHVWVGTGSAPIRSNVIIGRGVFKSTDAGRSFQFMGLKESGQIGGIRVHPSNPDIVWLAALGSPFGPNDERGIFKTSDGGRTWKKTLFVDHEHGGRDVEVDWQNPSIVYAAIYRGFRKGWDIVSGGPADKGGIYKSTDGGDTWKKISAGLPGKLIGKIDLDIARSNPNVLYAMVEAPGSEGGLYRSSDAGESWTLVNSSQRLRARPFYFHYVTVNPKNENEVWVNELGLHKSSDGGKTFTTVGTPHGDNHGMWFNPDNPDIILQINDGGGNVSLNGGRSWSSILNQPHAEYYMVAVDEQHPYRLYVP